MDTLLCDELLQEIFNRLPPNSLSSVSLVSKRWLCLIRASTSSVSLNLSPPYNPNTINSLSAFLSQHPFLCSLSIAIYLFDGDSVILAVSASCPNLRHLRFLSSPVSPFSLYTLSTSCVHLSSISITVARPLSFDWVSSLDSLKGLSLFLSNPSTERSNLDEFVDVELNLESVSLCGVMAGDYWIGYLWRNCRNVKKLQLKSCESLGDYTSFSGFVKLLSGLQVVELRTCRSIVDRVLSKLAESCVSLESLLVYDGGRKEGLLHFINHSRCNLKRVDLRLPLDLDNSHLIALAENLSFRGLVSLTLQSCCLVTGEGLRAIGRAMGSGLEELALINCDVVERETGLLATLGQGLKRLRKLDLSYNDMLLDKELVSMLVSCSCLRELKLRGCNKLTNTVVSSMVRSCRQLQSIDITYCFGIEIGGVEFLLLNSPGLRRVEVEESKLSEVASEWASNKFIEVVS